MTKDKFNTLLELSVLFFLGLHVITSQLSVALSSIGLGGLIITGTLRLFTGKYYKPDKKLVYLFIILIIFRLISSAFSEYPAESFLLSKRVLLYISFFYTIIYIKSREQLKYLLSFLLIFTFIICIIELFKYFQYQEFSDNVPLGDIRLHEFGHAITNGEIKMLFLLIFISLLFTNKNYFTFPFKKELLNKYSEKWISKTVYIIVLIPLVLTFYFTNSRGPFLGFIAGTLTIGIIKSKKFLIGFIILIIAFLFFAPSAYKNRILSITDMNDPTNNIRIKMWNVGLLIIKDHPITGIGDINFPEYYQRYKKIELRGEGSHMHNNILEMAVETGIPGLISWLLLMCYLIFSLLKIYIRNRYEDDVSILPVISIAAFIAMQVSGLTEYNFGDFEFNAVLWFSLGIGFLADKLSSIKDNTE